MAAASIDAGISTGLGTPSQSLPRRRDPFPEALLIRKLLPRPVGACLLRSGHPYLVSTSSTSRVLVHSRCASKSKYSNAIIRAASNVSIVVGDHDNGESRNNYIADGSSSAGVNSLRKYLSGVFYLPCIAAVLLGCMLAFLLVAFPNSSPAAILSAVTKSGFSAAITLILLSEVGDKTFFIAALLAMQYGKALVLVGSVGALSFMTILSLLIGRLLNYVPIHFRTTLPVEKYAAVAFLLFFGFKSIKDAWDLPANERKNNKGNVDIAELVEAKEPVEEKVAKKLRSPLEILCKSFSLVFFAEWGDRSMLATIALGAAQPPVGVAAGAIAGHLISTSIAVLGGTFLAKHISEKMVGYLGGALFLIFAMATLFGVF